MILIHLFSVGYVYLVFDLEKSVKALLQACSQRRLHPTDYLEYYYKISSKKIRCKVVSVMGMDSFFVRYASNQMSYCF